MEEKAISKVNTEATPTVHEIENTDSELYKVGVCTTAAFATGVGAWALICLSSAVISSEGPLELAKTLFLTITGI